MKILFSWQVFANLFVCQVIVLQTETNIEKKKILNPYILFLSIAKCQYYNNSFPERRHGLHMQVILIQYHDSHCACDRPGTSGHFTFTRLCRRVCDLSWIRITRFFPRSDVHLEYKRPTENTKRIFASLKDMSRGCPRLPAG